MLVLQSLLFGLLIFLVAFCASVWWSRRRLYHLAAKIPGPKGYPIIGMGHKFINADFKQIFKALIAVTEGYDTIMKMWIGPELAIFAHTPESLQVVLNSQKCLDKSPLYEVLIVKTGLLLSNGNVWRNHRKILSPAFSIGVLKSLVPTFDAKARIFVKNLEAEVGKKPFDVYGYTSACSLETLLKGTMSTDRDIQSDPLRNVYIHQVESAAQIMMTKMLNILYQFEPIYRFTHWYELEQKDIYDGVLKIADEIYDDKRGLTEMALREASEDDDGFSYKNKNFINTLINPNNGLTELEIKDEINTLVAAGHETSALVISNALLMLALHPEVQQKAVQEIKEVYGSVDAPVDYESLNQLTYLDMVVKETMRLFPVLPVSARKATEEFEIGEYTIPVGATIIISSFNVQRNKKYWGEDADLFIPERFEPANFEKIHPYAYIPFTGGPRICIGWRYGMLFMKSVLVNFLRNFEASSDLDYNTLDYELIISMKIAQKCMISVQKRDF